ncbi:response regulator transcription factor [Rubrolithibacter danxiaensis]|uniref:response regulator transcription factor n=1 Tax=Rubrolithibacter danxiaensis TaxID=3390805 RepID=UPI003BF84A32
MIKKVLVLEDEKDIREIIGLILKDAGYLVSSSALAKDFFLQIDTFCPDLIILDIALPDGDGREICKALKSNKRTLHIPVIIISAHPAVANIVKEVGADDFLAKPFDIDELAEHVRIKISA